MYNFLEFVNESRTSYLEVFDYFYTKIMDFFEKRKKDDITYWMTYEKREGTRFLYQTLEEIMYILSNGKEFPDLKDKPKLYRDIIEKSAIGIRFTNRKGNSGVFTKMKSRMGTKYFVLVSEHIPNGALAMRKFNKESGTTTYLYDKFKIPEVKQSLFHEFIHLIDKLKIEDKGVDTPRIGYKDSNYDKVKTDKGMKKNYDVYINSTPEFNARVIAAYSRVKGNAYTSFEDFKKDFMDYLSDDFKNKINEYNRRRLLKVIYNFYNSL